MRDDQSLAGFKERGESAMDTVVGKRTCGCIGDFGCFICDIRGQKPRVGDGSQLSDEPISPTCEAVVLDWIERYAATLQAGVKITPYSATLLINTVRHHDRQERERRIAEGDQSLTDKLYVALKAMAAYANDERKGLKIAEDALYAYETK